MSPNYIISHLIVIMPAYLLVTIPGSWLVKAVLKPWIQQLQNSQSESDSASLVKAGVMIGYLERTLMLTFILLGEFTAVGFVLALKAAYRFKDTGNHAQAEYMLMGTFLSLLITLAVGLGASFLLLSGTR